MLIGVGVSYIAIYLNVNLNGLSRFWKRDRTDFSAIVYLLPCDFCSEGVHFPLGAWDRLRYSIVTLFRHSI